MEKIIVFLTLLEMMERLKYKKKIDNTCKLVVEHCWYSHLEGDGLKCTECEKGFALNKATNQCFESENCLKVDGDGKCTGCNNKVNIYIQANQEGECVFDTCKKYNDDGECTECSDYFYLNDKGKCSYIQIPYCKKLKKEDQKKCDDTSYFLKGKEPRRIWNC